RVAHVVDADHGQVADRLLWLLDQSLHVAVGADGRDAEAPWVLDLLHEEDAVLIAATELGQVGLEDRVGEDDQGWPIEPVADQRYCDLESAHVPSERLCS